MRGGDVLVVFFVAQKVGSSFVSTVLYSRQEGPTRIAFAVCCISHAPLQAVAFPVSGVENAEVKNAKVVNAEVENTELERERWRISPTPLEAFASLLYHLEKALVVSVLPLARPLLSRSLGLKTLIKGPSLF